MTANEHGQPKAPILLTIPLSHYCERARWALDRAAIHYREEPHLPIRHREFTALYGAKTVPVLITHDMVLKDSAAIIAWSDTLASQSPLIPIEPTQRDRVLELDHFLEQRLGPHVRRWVYAHLLGSPQLLRQCYARGVPFVERMIAPLLVRFALPRIRSYYQIDADTGRASLEAVREAFREIENCLADGRRYLCGELITMADITAASLSAPLLFPSRYRCTLPPIEAISEAMRRDVQAMRATTAGVYIRRLFEQDRG